MRFAGPADQLCDPAAGDAIQALAAKQPSIVTALQVVQQTRRRPFSGTVMLGDELSVLLEPTYSVANEKSSCTP